MNSPVEEVQNLRAQGLTDSVIMEELTQKGLSPDAVNQAIMSLEPLDVPPSPNGAPGAPNPFPNQTMQPPMGDMQPPTGSGYSDYAPNVGTSSSPANVYDRIEEITENLIDEKWDELISEVKKIVDWKNKFEEKQMKLAHDVAKLKEDFSTLHQGVLGKLDDYDNRMQDVGTELNAVGKVFKDVVPQFVENVKELNSLTDKIKKK